MTYHGMTDSKEKQEIEVTPEMIEAGVTVLELARGAYDLSQTASEVYTAMELVRLDQNQHQ